MKTKHVNRRDFFRLSATAGVSAMLIPGARAAGLPQVTANENEIPVRTLGRTGVKLPILSMGVMRADNPNVVRAAYNSGIFHFDTAHGYQAGRMKKCWVSSLPGSRVRASLLLPKESSIIL